jgi:hypothetical protein
MVSKYGLLVADCAALVVDGDGGGLVLAGGALLLEDTEVVGGGALALEDPALCEVDPHPAATATKIHSPIIGSHTTLRFIATPLLAQKQYTFRRLQRWLVLVGSIPRLRRHRPPSLRSGEPNAEFL